MFGRNELISSVKRITGVSDVLAVMKEVYPSHSENIQDHSLLRDNYKGKQKVLSKLKKTRKDINNKIVTNNLFYIVSFKVGYVFGEPIQYISKNSDKADQIDKLNDLFFINDKSTLDKELAENWYIGGTGYRIAVVDKDNPYDIGIYNLDPDKTGVVYSSDIRKTKLLSFYATKSSENGLLDFIVYTDKNVYSFTSDLGFEINESEVKVSTNGYGINPIVEYPLNKDRLGLVELVLSQTDALNKLTSLEIDDNEQFVNSLLIFTNATIDIEEYDAMIKKGAVMLKSDEGPGGLRADVKAIANKLPHSDVKILHDKIYSDALSIAGVPRMSDAGTSSGETGQAKYVGEGWTMAEERAKQDELSFKKADKELLKVILKLAETKGVEGISDLEIHDVDTKFSRNRTDNLLVKTQSLTNLMSAKVDPQTAFELSGLTNDPVAMLEKQEAYFGEKVWAQEKKEKPSLDNENHKEDEKPFVD